jgi:hypothetical protein
MTDDLPTVGESFVDASGTYWRVQDVQVSDRLAGFFLVKLARGPTPARDGGQMVLARREFLALERERGLKRVQA